MSCNACTKDCPVRDSQFYNQLEKTLRGLQQGYAMPEMIVDRSWINDTRKIEDMCDVYNCFSSCEAFDAVDQAFKTGQGYVCDILRNAFQVWKWDKGLEKDRFAAFLVWDRGNRGGKK